LENSGYCTIVGPVGRVLLSKGVIVAKRHIHASEKDALDHGLYDGQVVEVKVEGSQRSGIFSDVVVRVNKNFHFAMHVDTDEANAMGANLGNQTYGKIIV
jgi:putative phosphotransacetylase